MAFEFKGIFRIVLHVSRSAADDSTTYCSSYTVQLRWQLRLQKMIYWDKLWQHVRNCWTLEFQWIFVVICIFLLIFVGHDVLVLGKCVPFSSPPPQHKPKRLRETQETPLRDWPSLSTSHHPVFINMRAIKMNLQLPDTHKVIVTARQCMHKSCLLYTSRCV